MQNITLTILQRLNVEGVLRAQRVEVANIDLLKDLYRKIRIDPDERASYVTDLPDGNAFLNMKKIKASSPKDDVTVELETSEVRKLRKLLEEWKINVDDSDWFDPLMAQLTNPTKAEKPSKVEPEL